VSEFIKEGELLTFMIVLGINASHLATACLFKDGKILACISEERLTGIKNQSGIPTLAIRKALEISKVSPGQVDVAAFSFEDMAINSGFGVLGGPEIQIGEKYWNPVMAIIWKLKEWLMTNIPAIRYVYVPSQKFYYQHFLFPKLKVELLGAFERKTKIKKEKVFFVNHHTAHAYSAYFGAPKYWEGEKLILTLDAMGDGACATVNAGEGGNVRRIATTPFGNSIGDLYAYVTRYLGMKMGEHEYKVMGLGPYASQKLVEKVYERIKDWIWVNKKTLQFESKVFSHVFYRLLNKPFKNERFDNIAAATQRLTEDLIVEWVKACIAKTGIKDVVCAGGVFMNVKANQKIAELPEVKSLFVFPSCGDESTAMGGAYYIYQKAREKDRSLDKISPIEALYFGPEYSDPQIQRELKKKKYSKYKVSKVQDIEKEIAKLLSQRKIVARFAGRMEWGARALGNRSILTHPQNLEGVRDINEQIKSRDFWMPFAPSILSNRMKKYVLNPKNIPGPYMILAYATTKEGAEKLRAAIHQYDFSARPQEVFKEHNPSYHRIIGEFEKLTGIGAVLNTSFNLHGYPIVCSPQDALYVFGNSGLKYLALESFLIEKV
jgi:carbamoyltransferase